MLAPYIPMDDDFQLRTLDQLSSIEPIAKYDVLPLMSIVSPLHMTEEVKSAPNSPFSGKNSRTPSPIRKSAQPLVKLEEQSNQSHPGTPLRSKRYLQTL